MDEFDFVSPMDYRYYRKEFAVFLSENARVKYQAKVEAALVRALSRHGVCSSSVAAEVEKAAQKIRALDVYEEEKKTRHDVRALVNVLRKNVSESARPFVHLGATSYDIVDTANALRFKDATKNLLIPSLVALERCWIKLALKHRETLQIGRTHGQHAVPITFGFAMAGYVDRLGNRIKEIERACDNLQGKFSGAVGAFNAASLVVSNPQRLEADIMGFLRLKTARHSTQIVPPEPMQDLVNSVMGAFAVLANFADDMRHLQRTEIGEIAEEFSKDQVGSSTMPHKRNPVSFENVKSMFKAFVPRVVTVFLDSVSEHQRDLTNSASQRFLPELFAALVYCSQKMTDSTKKLFVDAKAMKHNFELSSSAIVAEPLYIILALHGHKNAHEAVREITIIAQKTHRPVFDVAMDDKKLRLYLMQFSKKQTDFIRNPANYVGLSAKKTSEVCGYWKGVL